MALISLDCLADGTCLEGFRDTVDCSLAEMGSIYQERLPYEIGETITGQCVSWSDTFITLCRYAMSTDCMDGMSAQEKALWRAFVAYEDIMSTSAEDTMCGGAAIGCTIEDENGNSYAVCADGSISNELCTEPPLNYPKEYLYASLDAHFMALVNCEPVNGCGCEEQHELIYNDCEMCGPDYPTCPVVEFITVKEK